MNRLQELAGIANTSILIVEGLSKLKPEDIKTGSDYLFTLPGTKYEKTVYSAPIKVKVLGALNDQWFSITPLEDKEGLKRNEKYKAEYTNLHSLDTKFDGFNNPLQEVANIPSDVKNLGAAQTKATTVSNKAKMINNIQEFPGAFENWFGTLGFEPGKISKSAIRSAVEKSLTNLGYK
jgi:hypothetical protein